MGLRPDAYDVQVTGVSKLPIVAGAPDQTSKPFPLRFMFYVDAGGSTSLVPQLFMGKLNTPGNPLGLCFRESQLLASAKASAVRLVSAHLPIGLDASVTPNQYDSTSKNELQPGGTLIRTVNLSYDNAVNPFVHAFHPDHDNRKPGDVNDKQPEGVESYNLKRVMTFRFDPTPANDPEYNISYITGKYEETISLPPDTATTTKAMTYEIKTKGTFTLNRISQLPLTR